MLRKGDRVKMADWANGIPAYRDMVGTVVDNDEDEWGWVTVWWDYDRRAGHPPYQLRYGKRRGREGYTRAVYLIKVDAEPYSPATLDYTTNATAQAEANAICDAHNEDDNEPESQ